VRQAEDLLLRYRLVPDPTTPEHEAEQIETLGLRSANLGLWSGAYIADCEMRPAPSVRRIHRFAAWHDPRLRLFNYTADEISRCPGLVDDLRAWARNLHEAGVDQLVTMVPERPLLRDGSGTGRSAVDIWVLLPAQLDVLEREDPQLLARVRAKGDEIWSYTALVQDPYSPKWELDFAPVNYRILPGFLNQAEGVTGILYWAVDYWQPDPWHNVDYDDSGPDGYPGEGHLVYPGGPAGVAGVVPSMRLAWIREGMEDYEYVQILRDRGLGELALDLIAPAATDWRSWSQDPEVLETVRASLADAIVTSNR
jgi:hypothetical protein